MNRRDFLKKATLIGGAVVTGSFLSGEPNAVYANPSDPESKESDFENNGEYDLVIKNGTLIDTAQGLNGTYHVAIKNGKVANIFKENDHRNYQARQIIDATGLIVTPGLIDAHAHPMGAQGFLSADDMGINKGVTTIVNAGSYGPDDIESFIENTIKKAVTNTVAFLHISKTGMNPEYPDTYDFAKSLKLINQYPQYIKAIKIRLGDMVDPTKRGLPPLQSDGLVGTIAAKRLALDAGLPLEIHVGGPLPNITAVMNILDKGDFVVHYLNGKQGGILDPATGKLWPQVLAARARGVIFDVGHGGQSFDFDVAESARAQGFDPDIISSDLHGGDYKLVVSLIETMNKFLAIGYSLEDIIKRTTEKPAIALRMEDQIGTLKPSRAADITILELVNESKTYQDAYPHNDIRIGKQQLVTQYTIKDGKVVFQKQQ